jgi:hypothetical protein
MVLEGFEREKKIDKDDEDRQKAGLNIAMQ